jgi:hypothetical protein
MGADQNLAKQMSEKPNDELLEMLRLPETLASLAFDVEPEALSPALKIPLVRLLFLAFPRGFKISKRGPYRVELEISEPFTSLAGIPRIGVSGELEHQ